ncbi:MAG: hypothetical protein H6622_15250 [Halobacteriovoraceae bacterium]|nr:hypothetical protein [Halobacteriovoraceae bacterium]
MKLLFILVLNLVFPDGFAQISPLSDQQMNEVFGQAIPEEAFKLFEDLIDYVNQADSNDEVDPIELSLVDFNLLEPLFGELLEYSYNIEGIHFSENSNTSVSINGVEIPFIRIADRIDRIEYRNIRPYGAQESFGSLYISDIQLKSFQINFWTRD